MTKRTSEFDAWFLLQFGELPSANRLSKLRQRVSRLQLELRDVERKLADEEGLGTEYRSALYAWQAARGEKS